MKYVQSNGLKGRTFASLADQNRFLLEWEQSVVDTSASVARATRASPQSADRVAQHRSYIPSDTLHAAPVRVIIAAAPP